MKSSARASCQVDGAVVELAEVLDLDDVIVPDGRGGPRLLIKALHGLGGGGDLGAQELDGDLFVDVDVLGQVDLAHPALAEHLDEAVAVVQDHAHPAVLVGGSGFEKFGAVLGAEGHIVVIGCVASRA